MSDIAHAPVEAPSVAIVGAGPAGFYTAESLLERIPGVQIDILERLPTPFGLIRAGVAPDHQSTKQVTRRFEQAALAETVQFFGNVEVGRDVAISDLRQLYDAVVLAVGSGDDRPLGIPGEHLQGVYGSAVFVGWYNGHPDFRDLAPKIATERAVVIGNGNVALDVARVLLKTRDEMAISDLPEYVADAIAAAPLREVTIVGRRGPESARFSLAELREMASLTSCAPTLNAADLPEAVTMEDAKQRRTAEKIIKVLRSFISDTSDPRPKRLTFRFRLAPVAVLGTSSVTGVRFERIRSDAESLTGTGEFEDIPCGLVVAAVGYRAVPIPGLPFDGHRGLYPNVDGRIEPGLYAVGWAKRGPTGVIGTNKPDGELCAEQIATEASTAGAARAGKRRGREGLLELLQQRGIRAVSFSDWERIDRAEIAAASGPAPRRKFTSLREMLSVLADGAAGSPSPLSTGEVSNRPDPTSSPSS